MMFCDIEIWFLKPVGGLYISLLELTEGLHLMSCIEPHLADTDER